MTQPLMSTMMGAISANLSSINPQLTTTLGGVTGRPAAGTDDVYECFLLFEILQELQNCKATNIKSNPSNQPIDLRRSPGNFNSAPSKFSYISFFYDKKDYELHVSTMVQTTARNARCELDVAIFDADVRQRSEPTHRDVKLFVEAKYYSDNIDISLAREFIGLSHRMSTKKCFGTLVTCAGIDPNAKALIQGGWRKFRCHEDVSLNRNGLAKLRSDIKSEIKQIFS